MANKKEKRESSKKQKYKGFQAGKDKRIDDIDKSVKSYQNEYMGDKLLIGENDDKISQFLRSNKRNKEKK